MTVRNNVLGAHRIFGDNRALSSRCKLGILTLSVREAQRVGVIEFQVCRRGRDARWVVTRGNAIYGAYLDKEQALLDAVDAARDALAAGQEAQVWIKERAAASRVF